MGGWTGIGRDRIYFDGQIEQRELEPGQENDLVTKHYADSVGGVTDHTLLTNIGTNTHTQIDTHLSSNAIHFSSEAIYSSISENTNNAEATSSALIVTTSNAEATSSALIKTTANAEATSSAYLAHAGDSSDPHGATLTQTDLNVTGTASCSLLSCASIDTTGLIQCSAISGALGTLNINGKTSFSEGSGAVQYGGSLLNLYTDNPVPGGSILQMETGGDNNIWMGLRAGTAWSMFYADKDTRGGVGTIGAHPFTFRTGNTDRLIVDGDGTNTTFKTNIFIENKTEPSASGAGVILFASGALLYAKSGAGNVTQLTAT